MAIFFGDELKSSNKNFPIIDISENNAKGVIFVKDVTNPVGLATDDLFNATNVPWPKVSQGTVLVDRATGDVFIYIGFFSNGSGGSITTGNYNPDSDTDLDNPNNDTGVQGTDYYSFFTVSGNPNWKSIGNTPVFASDIIANIGADGAFGKYLTGQNVPLSGKTALEAIEEALTQYQVPVTGDIVFNNGKMGTRTFDIAERLDEFAGLVGSFTVKNSNVVSMDSSDSSGNLQDFGIKKIEVFRDSSTAFSTDTSIAKIEWSGSAWQMTGNLTSNSNGLTQNFSGIQALNIYNSSTVTSQFYFQDTTYDLAGRDSGNFKYRVEVTGYQDDTASKLSEDNRKGHISVSAYSQASITSRNVSRIDTGVISTNEASQITTTSGDRLYGNVNSDVSFTVQNNTPTTTISTLRVKRAFDNSNTYTTVHETSVSIAYNSTSTITFDDGLSAVYTGSESLPITSRDYDKIKYRVEIIDNGTAATSTNEVPNSTTTVQMFAPVRIAYATTSFDDTNASSQASAILTAASASSDIPIEMGTGDASVISSIGNFSVNSGSAANEYLYLCYPNTDNSGDSPTHNTVVDLASGQNLTDAFTKVTPGAGVSVDLGVAGGAQAINYTVYISNAAGSFNDTSVVYNIS